MPKEYSSFLPHRAEQVIKNFELPIFRIDRVVQVTSKVFAANSLKNIQYSSLDFPAMNKRFAGNRKYLFEKIGDWIQDTGRNSSISKFVSKATATVIDLNDFRSFDEGNALEATWNTGITLNGIKSAFSSEDTDFQHFVTQLWGDEYVVISLPKKDKTYDEIKRDINRRIYTSAQNICAIEGTRKSAIESTRGKASEGSREFLSCKAKSLFLFEAASQINMNTVKNSKDPFQTAISEIENSLTDYQDSSNDARTKYYSRDNLLIQNCFGNRLDSDLTPEETKVVGNFRILNVDNRPDLLKDRTIKEVPIEPENYPEWMKEALNFFGYDANNLPLIRQLLNNPDAIKPMLEFLGKNEEFAPLAANYLNWLVSTPLLDSFSDVTEYMPILTHEAFTAHLLQEAKSLDKKKNDLSLMTFDLGLLKEVNDNIGFGESNIHLAAIFRNIEKILSSYQDYFPVVSKEGGRIFIKLKGNKNFIHLKSSEIEEKIAEAIEQMNIPLFGDKGILSKYVSRTNLKFPAKYDSMDTKYFAGHNIAYLSEESEVNNESVSVYNLIDKARKGSDKNKHRSYLQRIIDADPIAYLIFRIDGKRLISRVNIVKKIMEEENIELSSINPFFYDLFFNTHTQ